MGTLKNPRKEAFAHKLIEYKGDRYKAMAAVHEEGHFKNEASMKSQAKGWMCQSEVKERIMEIMNLIYSPEQLEHDIQEIRKATKPIVYNGEITDTHPDFAVRLELLKFYAKSAGVGGGETPTNQTNVQFNIGGVDTAAALAIAKEISELSKGINPDNSGRRN